MKVLARQRPEKNSCVSDSFLTLQRLISYRGMSCAELGRLNFCFAILKHALLALAKVRYEDSVFLSKSNMALTLD